VQHASSKSKSRGGSYKERKNQSKLDESATLPPLCLCGGSCTRTPPQRARATRRRGGGHLPLGIWASKAATKGDATCSHLNSAAGEATSSSLMMGVDQTVGGSEIEAGAALAVGEIGDRALGDPPVPTTMGPARTLVAAASSSSRSSPPRAPWSAAPLRRDEGEVHNPLPLAFLG
jgi:hypothetical protein